MNVISIKNLKKHFGKTRAVDGVSLEVKKGEIFGFLGPNGAGKTTTIRCMMDFLRPDKGSIKILGLDSERDSVEIDKKIGYLSGAVRLYDGWTGDDHINLIKKIKRNGKFAKELIKRLDFDPTKKFYYLSSGNKQKLGLILAFMGKPEVIILDEPTLGLDPLLQNEIYKILKELKNQGSTIFMSSHNLSEVERICDKVGIIKQGKIIAEENIETLKRKAIYEVHLYFERDFQKSDFEKIKGVKVTSEFDNGIALTVKRDINPLIDELSKYQLKDVRISRASLDEIFLEYYEK